MFAVIVEEKLTIPLFFKEVKVVSQKNLVFQCV
jgi:hypothetical protein